MKGTVNISGNIRVKSQNTESHGESEHLAQITVFKAVAENTTSVIS